MELREGFKLTEVGIIPEDWRVVPMKTFCKSSAFGPRFSGELYDPNGNVAILRTTDLDDDGNISYSTMPLARLNENRFKEHLLKQHDFLITRSGTCGIATVFETFDTPVLPGAFLIRFRFTDEIDPYFLTYYVNSAAGKSRMEQLSFGAVQKNISGTTLLNTFFPLPSIAEQRSIAKALIDVDAQITSLNQLIIKKRNLAQGAMQQLLTGNKRLAGFTDDWEEKTIAEVAPLQRGFDLPNRELRRGDHPVVYSNGILNSHVTYKAKAPGVVTGRSGTIGKVIFVEEDYFPHNTTLWVTDFKGNNPKFIYYLYVFLKLQRFSTGSGVPTLNRNDVHAYSISMPRTGEEQKAIAQTLSDMDAEIEKLEEQHDKYKAIKQGMMQELLTGKTRLI